MTLQVEARVELTPDITGRAYGGRFTDPWFDADHDGDIASSRTGSEVEPPSSIVTAPPRSPPRSVPPAPDTTFAIPWPQPRTRATTPEIAKRRGTADTLLSAPWFHDASDAAEWRAVAEERRGLATAPVVARRVPLPLWIAAAAAFAGFGLAIAGVGVLVLTLTAVFLLG